MKIFKRIIFGLFFILIAGLAGLAAYIETNYDNAYESPYPELRATTDSAVIEKGKYLVYGPAHCASCHVPFEKNHQIKNGETPPLEGGLKWDLPFGNFQAANISPDMETGIGNYTDEEIARILRYGVKPDGRACTPFMTSHNLSDEDIVAVISYLRVAEPVNNKIETMQINFLGKAFSTFLMRPRTHTMPPPEKSPEPGPTVERGKYLAHNVAQCFSCHTLQDETGSVIGEPFAGGTPMQSDHDPNLLYTPVNITPDPETGIVGIWSEDYFLERFRQGRILKGDPMPWSSFANMTDDDIRAIYRYLKTVKPVKNITLNEG